MAWMLAGIKESGQMGWEWTSGLGVGPGCKGGQTSNHLGAVRNCLLAVESTLGARETLTKSIHVRDAETCRALGRGSKRHAAQWTGAARRTWQITRVSLLTVGCGRALMKRLLAGCLTAARLRFWKARILHRKHHHHHHHHHQQQTSQRMSIYNNGQTSVRIVSRNRGAGSSRGC